MAGKTTTRITSKNVKSGKTRTTSKSTNKYQKTGRQMHRETMAKMRNDRVIANKRADTIRAVGTAIAHNLVPTASSGMASAATAKVIENSNQLINAGTGVTQTPNNSTDTQNEKENRDSNYRE